MYNHAPKEYHCPFCLLINAQGNDITNQQDIFYKDDFVTAFISGKWWPRNAGGIIIIPNNHFENIYEFPNELGHKIFDFSKKVAIALKEVYNCDGVSTRQHNEPAGDQEVWHYHFHVVPRYKNDEFYTEFKNFRLPSQKERLPFAEKMRKYFKEHE